MWDTSMPIFNMNLRRMFQLGQRATIQFIRMLTLRVKEKLGVKGGITQNVGKKE